MACPVHQRVVQLPTSQPLPKVEKEKITNGTEGGGGMHSMSRLMLFNEHFHCTTAFQLTVPLLMNIIHMKRHWPLQKHQCLQQASFDSAAHTVHYSTHCTHHSLRGQDKQIYRKKIFLFCFFHHFNLQPFLTRITHLFVLAFLLSGEKYNIFKPVRCLPTAPFLPFC
uniref:Uncharacterized protein n=1 Tax=Qingyuan Parti tick virus 1 TaxID=2972280 RepID=A0A9E7V255_9VIRU|nr:MAG: hypothetical protein [Qingyuan Parti tick virus 1]